MVDYLNTIIDEKYDALVISPVADKQVFATNSGWGLAYGSYLERHPGRFVK